MQKTFLHFPKEHMNISGYIPPLKRLTVGTEHPGRVRDDAVVWVLGHELGHVKLKHAAQPRGSRERVQQEIDAWKFAREHNPKIPNSFIRHYLRGYIQEYNNHNSEPFTVQNEFSIPMPFPGSKTMPASSIPIQTDKEEEPLKVKTWRLKKYMQDLHKAFDPSYLSEVPGKKPTGSKHPMHGATFDSLADARVAMDKINYGFMGGASVPNSAVFQHRTGAEHYFIVHKPEQDKPYFVAQEHKLPEDITELSHRASDSPTGKWALRYEGDSREPGALEKAQEPAFNLQRHGTGRKIGPGRHEKTSTRPYYGSMYPDGSKKTFMNITQATDDFRDSPHRVVAIHNLGHGGVVVAMKNSAAKEYTVKQFSPPTKYAPPQTIESWKASHMDKVATALSAHPGWKVTNFITKALTNVAAERGKAWNALSHRWVKRAFGIRPSTLQKHEEQRGPYLNEIFDPQTKRWRLQFGANRPASK